MLKPLLEDDKSAPEDFWMEGDFETDQTLVASFISQLKLEDADVMSLVSDTTCYLRGLYILITFIAPWIGQESLLFGRRSTHEVHSSQPRVSSMSPW